MEIPPVVIDRLPLYARALASLESQGREVVSSQEMGSLLNVTPAQIRKDLSYFGRFGKQGRAILGYQGFAPQGFRIIEAFDAEPETVGSKVDGLLIKHTDELEAALHANPVDVGIVAVPGAIAQEVIDGLVRCGVRAILNYAPIAAHVPRGVQIRRIDPVLALQSMTYYLKSRAVPAK